MHSSNVNRNRRKKNTLNIETSDFMAEGLKHIPIPSRMEYNFQKSISIQESNISTNITVTAVCKRP